MLDLSNLTFFGFFTVKCCWDFYHVFQNSPEVDEEGYSIRPDDESEEADILSTAWYCELVNESSFTH